MEFWLAVTGMKEHFNKEEDVYVNLFIFMFFVCLLICLNIQREALTGYKTDVL